MYVRMFFLISLVSHAMSKTGLQIVATKQLRATRRD